MRDPKIRLSVLGCVTAISFVVCAQPVGSDAQLERDARLAAERSDKALNIAWKAATKRIQEMDRASGRDRQSVPALDRMKESQRKWLAFRDAECGIYSELTGGSIDRINYLGCVDTLTQRRTNDLKEWSTTP